MKGSKIGLKENGVKKTELAKAQISWKREAMRRGGSPHSHLWCGNFCVIGVCHWSSWKELCGEEYF